jgi:hypothetical protein
MSAFIYIGCEIWLLRFWGPFGEQIKHRIFYVEHLTYTHGMRQKTRSENTAFLKE